MMFTIMMTTKTTPTLDYDPEPSLGVAGPRLVQRLNEGTGWGRQGALARRTENQS